MLIDLRLSALEGSFSLKTSFLCPQLLSAHLLLNFQAIFRAHWPSHRCLQLKPSSGDLINPLKFSEGPLLKQWFMIISQSQLKWGSGLSRGNKTWRCTLVSCLKKHEAAVFICLVSQKKKDCWWGHLWRALKRGPAFIWSPYTVCMSLLEHTVEWGSEI